MKDTTRRLHQMPGQAPSVYYPSPGQQDADADAGSGLCCGPGCSTSPPTSVAAPVLANWARQHSPVSCHGFVPFITS
jgi:hypothetical protein